MDVSFSVIARIKEKELEELTEAVEPVEVFEYNLLSGNVEEVNIFCIIIGKCSTICVSKF